MARRPSQWADDQRHFHEAYNDDPTPFARQRVTVRWSPGNDGSPVGGGVGVVGLLASLISLGALLLGRKQRGVPVFHPAELYVFPAPGAVGARAVRFPISEPLLTDQPLEADAMLVGECTQNGTCCVELQGQVLWPSYNPALVESLNSEQK